MHPLPLRRCAGYIFSAQEDAIFLLVDCSFALDFSSTRLLPTKRNLLFSTSLRVAIDAPPSLRRCGRGVARANISAMDDRWPHFNCSSILVCTSTYLPVSKMCSAKRGVGGNQCSPVLEAMRMRQGAD